MRKPLILQLAQKIEERVPLFQMHHALSKQVARVMIRSAARLCCMHVHAQNIGSGLHATVLVMLKCKSHSRRFDDWIEQEVFVQSNSALQYHVEGFQRVPEMDDQKKSEWGCCSRASADLYWPSTCNCDCSSNRIHKRFRSSRRIELACATKEVT